MPTTRRDALKTLSGLGLLAALPGCAGSEPKFAAGPAPAPAPGHAPGHTLAAAGGKPPSALGASAAFDANGRLWAATAGDGHVWVRHSDDLGRRWSAPVRVNDQPETVAADGEQKPTLVLGPRGEVLIVWTRPMRKPYTGEIRFSRSPDGSRFAPPVTVHRDRAEITHRFPSMLTDARGRLYVVWVDKRDLEAARVAGRAYRGAGLWYAVSEDLGTSFLPERRLAGHSCECCRIALARDTDGGVIALWRHVFAPNERDHAWARLDTDAAGAPPAVQRATFDHWRLDACPHHGPGLAVDGRGARHAVWLGRRGAAEPAVYYGRLSAGGVEGQRPIPDEAAEHADVAAAGEAVAVVWKSFGERGPQLRGELSRDGGRTWRPVELADTAGGADQPRLLSRGDRLFALWNTEREGLRLLKVTA